MNCFLHFLGLPSPSYPCPWQVGCNCVCAPVNRMFLCIVLFVCQIGKSIARMESTHLTQRGVQVVISSALVTATEQAQLPQFRISISPVACAARGKGGR